jgi:hypothetical protein
MDDAHESERARRRYRPRHEEQCAYCVVGRSLQAVAKAGLRGNAARAGHSARAGAGRGRAGGADAPRPQRPTALQRPALSHMPRRTGSGCRARTMIVMPCRAMPFPGCVSRERSSSPTTTSTQSTLPKKVGPSNVNSTSARVSGRTTGVLIHLQKGGDPCGWPVASVATAEPLRGRVAWTLRCRLVLGTWLVRPHGLAELGAGLVAAFPVVRRTAERLARGLPA